MPLHTMSAFDTAKEIVRIGSAAGLSKDVVDLLEKKVALLTGELSDARRKIASLEAEAAQLRQQLQRAQPQSDGFVESMGVLWKRTATGFESHPYCKHCAGNPIMSPIHGARKWVCGAGDHIAPFSVKPPAA
jgi:FtsZ-binding cell division protein ZapB